MKHGQEIPADEFIYYSPAVATPQQLAGFPKTFLIVGTLDLFVYEDMTEEKKQAIMNCETFDDLLDQEYGPLGTPERASFETEAEAFCLAETLKEQRRLAGLTQQELADKIGTKKSYISKLENGHADVQLSTLFRIFAGLGKRISLTVL